VQTLLAAISQYSYWTVFVLIFLEAIGLPVPGPLALLIAGALSAKGPLHANSVFLSAISAMLIGDVFMFLLGRRTGWWLLGILCRISLNPEACILQSTQTFYRRGRMLLIVAKFIPGINTLAPPTAGSMSMPFLQFLGLDLVGALLYICIYFGAGFVFSDFLAMLTKQYETFVAVLAWVFALALVTYLGYRGRLWFRARTLSPVPRLSPSTIAARLYSSSDPEIALFDVRSHGYYGKGALRIKGSLRLEPHMLPRNIEDLPSEKEIVVYCTCIREATSIRVARILREHGLNACVIEGGLRSWKKAGLPLETVPHEDVILLPTFS
jgi:membrane protein DedA with SNARE-associated domain/rhodanese-related sulfurtransferase